MLLGVGLAEVDLALVGFFALSTLDSELESSINSMNLFLRLFF